jgi:multidrug efflux system outer membrane protein
MPIPASAAPAAHTKLRQHCALCIGLTVAIALSGCTATGAPISAETLQATALSGGESGTSPPHRNGTQSLLLQWWKHFNDPLLTRFVAQALQANTSIRAAQASLQQSRALRDVRQAGLVPSASASGSAQRSQSNSNDPTSTFRAGLDANWDPDIFGSKRSALDATQADALAAQATLADVQASVAADVALAYLQLRGQQSQLAIARSNLASQNETLQITRWRAQAGLITTLEVEQARTAVEQTGAQIPALQTSIRKTHHSLAVLTGQAPEALQTLVDAPLPVPQMPPELTDGIAANTLRQRADVRAAEHRISAALARVSSAEAARYPSFSMGGSLTLSAASLAALSNGATLVNALLANMSVPLLDGGAARSQILAQEAALESARASYQSVVLTALKEVADALAVLGGDRQRLVRLENAADAANNAALLAQQRYTSGLIDFQTVLQTQRALLSTQDSVASTQADISADHVRLYKALGGGWNPEPTPFGVPQ